MTEFNPIGYLKSNRCYHEEQPRQGNLSQGKAYIELNQGYNYEQALKDLDGFSRIWLIYEFHQNKTWKPLTNPPRTDGKGKKGVFSTRSPYRPNPIGISCVKLIAVEKTRVYIEESDLLNNTPILDIKPYIPEYDSFPNAKTGWLENVVDNIFAIEYSQKAKEKIAFLIKENIDLEGVIYSQLGHNPFDKTRNKFISQKNGYILRFKSWRIYFVVADKKVIIKNILSGYTSFDILLGNDTEEDRETHKKFIKKWEKNL